MASLARGCRQRGDYLTGPGTVGDVRIVAILSPVAEWQPILAAAIAADELGFDGVGLWDHYHSAKPEWAYVAGWSAHAALAQATNRVRIVPAVLNTLHYELGVLAKESSTLSIASGGRFEMAVGAGDWPDSFGAWGKTFPDRTERIARLNETVGLLKRLWSGEMVTFEGDFNRLTDASCTPAPDSPPRVVVGVGGSITLARSAVEYADELNVYESTAAACRELVAESDRSIELSGFVDWSWDKWPAEPAGELKHWDELGVQRLFVSLGALDMPARLHELATLT